MTDDTPLSRKVSRLASKNIFDGGALRLGPSGDAEALSLVLNAVDDTMMLRDAVFGVEDSSVTLRISGKRVLRVVAASPELGADGLIGETLSTGDSEVLAGLAEVLRKLTAHSGTLTLERREVEASDHTTGAGVGVQSLSVALDAQVPAMVENLKDPIAAAILPFASAMVERVNGKVEPIGGNQPKVAELSPFLEAHWAGNGNSASKIMDNEVAPALQILDSYGSNDEALVVLKSEENQLFAVIQISEIPDVLIAWSATVRGK